MILLSVHCLTTAGGVDPFTNLLLVAGVVPLSFLLALIGLTVNDFLERRGGVKSVLLREVWLKAVDRYIKGGSNVSSHGRSASKKYEIMRTGAEGSAEEFQNTGTFIVVRSTLFVICSVITSPLARDA